MPLFWVGGLLWVWRHYRNRRWRGEDEGIAVGSGLRHGVDTDHFIAARAILNYDRLPEALGHFLCDQARCDICSSPGGGRNDDLDRFGRITLRLRRRGDQT